MAILRQTKENETRERALELLAETDDDLSERAWQTRTAPEVWFLDLSLEFGMPASQLRTLMTSRDETAYHARAIVRQAQSEIDMRYRRHDERHERGEQGG